MRNQTLTDEAEYENCINLASVESGSSTSNSKYDVYNNSYVYKFRCDIKHLLMRQNMKTV